ncbi:MAG: error-prone DNA polymerase, partial [Chlamydiia bacterium]|nr:error-prone DNA polymerase [Chlamydiia bacterium]
PGPIQGNMVQPFLKRRLGLAPVTYLHPLLEPALQETLGVILFQEQVLQAAVAVAGFNPAQADALRRVRSRRRSSEILGRMKGRFLEGAREKGVPQEVAEAVFASLEGFALYGFCKSHALSFARLSYLSAWLKLYYPAAFAAALINNQPMGFYPTETLMEDAKRHGVQVLPIDINASAERCTVDGMDLRLGLSLIHGFSEAACQKLLLERSCLGGFASLRHYYQSCYPSTRAVEALIQAGAFDSFGLERRDLLWQLWVLERDAAEGPSLFDLPCQVPPLPKADAWALMNGEYQTIGMSLQGHPMAHLRPSISPVADARALKTASQGARLSVAGMVVCRQRPPTAKGFAFLTIEDEYGMMNLILSPPVYERCRLAFRTGRFVLGRGVVDRRDGVVNLKLDDLKNLT